MRKLTAAHPAEHTMPKLQILFSELQNPSGAAANLCRHDMIVAHEPIPLHKYTKFDQAGAQRAKPILRLP